MKEGKKPIFDNFNSIHSNNYNCTEYNYYKMDYIYCRLSYVCIRN